MKLNKGEFYPDFKSDEIGYSVRPNNDNIVIMVEIYKKSMTKKVIDKIAIVKEQIIKEMLCRTGKDINVNIVNAKEIIEQVDKHTDIEKGGCVEVIDLLNGDFVTIELEVKEK